MEAVPETGTKGKLRRRLFFVLTNIVSIACLWWVLHDQKWGDFAQDIRELDWRWVTVAFFSDILVYVVQGWRWALILKPVSDLSVPQCIRAIYVGLFANEVLPLRTGEPIRCYLLARWSGLPFSVTLSSGLIERIFDGVWLLLGVLITLLTVSGLPGFVKDL